MKVLLLASAALFGLLGTSKAAVVEYTSQVSFNAAAPNLSNMTFSGFPIPYTTATNPYTYGPLTFTSNRSSIYLQNDSIFGRGYGSGVQYVDILSNYPVTSSTIISLLLDVKAISFYIGTYTGSDVVGILVNGVTQASLATFSSHPNTTFVGFTSDNPITSLIFSNAAGQELDFISFALELNSINSVPEPTSLTLLILSTIGMTLTPHRVNKLFSMYC